MRSDGVALAAVSEKSLEVMQALADEHGVAIRVAPTEATAPGDADRLVQVLVNLLSNAVKFSPPGSTIAVRALARPEEIEVQVEDQGRGIPAEHLHSIFGRFRSNPRMRARRAARAWGWPFAGRSSSSIRAPSAWRARQGGAVSSGSA
jgi:signal transduction histidine kinase